MSTTTELLDAYARKFGLKSDLQIAARLGLGNSAVSRYRHGRSMDDDVAIRVCNALGRDPAATLANLAADRNPNPKIQREWRRIAKQLGASAAGVAAIVISSTDALINAAYNYVCILCKIQNPMMCR